MATSSSSSSSNKDNPTIKWGIVGLGDVCQKKSGPAFFKCHGSELVAVMRRTPGKAAEWAQNTVPGGRCQGYDNLEAFLQHPNLQAVYISTRPGTHLDICQQVAAAGKAVYVEKPVGRCAAETQAMIDICQQAKVPLYTAYISRAYERTQATRQLLVDGVVGPRVTSISYRLVGTGGARGMDTQDLPWRLDVAQSGGGLIMDVGCHVLDRLDYLFGPLKDVNGKVENRANSYQVEDYVHLTANIGEATPPASSPPIPFEGAQVSCTWDFSASEGDEEVDELVISGPNGSLKMAGMSPNGSIQVLDAQGKVVQTMKDFEMPQHTAQGLIQAVTNDLLGKQNDQALLSKGGNAVRTQQVLDTALSSYYGGREMGYWNRSPDSWPGYNKKKRS